MTSQTFRSLSKRFPSLRIGILGDYCLDRYLEIDPSRSEVSIETGLLVHNVVHCRNQPGAAGTVLNNVAALGVGRIYPIGFAGEDGEGWELTRALRGKPGVRMEHFIVTSERSTWTYAKPLVSGTGETLREINRLDIKNWTPTPRSVTRRIRQSLRDLASELDALIVLEQSETPEVGVIHSSVLQELADLSKAHPMLRIFGDSRRGLSHFPPMIFKMNRMELQRMSRLSAVPSRRETSHHMSLLARRLGKQVFVTMAEEGMLGCEPTGKCWLAPSLPIREPIDVVGAGDAVMANLAVVLAAGARTPQALAAASAAASIVVHQMGTTGVARLEEIQSLLDQCRVQPTVFS